MRIAVAMSGGVDSSVAALLYHREGHEVLGITMQVWVDQPSACSPGRDNNCCGESHVNDARRVANQLGFAHYTLDFREDFQKHVVQNFKAEYAAGRTPIPCIHCNKSLKFDILLKKVRALGCEALATGHYVRRDQDPVTGAWKLIRGDEDARDQSYFLYALTQEQVSFLRFPVGTWQKDDVRAVAAEYNLPTSSKPDSQDICFVPHGDYRTVLEASDDFEVTPGEIVDTYGRVLGEHGGLHRFTIGQRKGLGIAAGRPLYVVKLDPQRNRVVVGDKEDLYAAGATVKEMNWIAGEPPSLPHHCEVKLRSLHRAAPCTITAVENDRVSLRFDQPEMSVTPGQAAVLYKDRELLGGGWIVG